ncbi:MAG TPA: cytochrome c biogenesis protein CcdA [Thermodesulfobacteriota bacterium]|nr:cytochrome c biogenesis protein CcdA [Thermodesulfobacteriota bacterium]
MGAENVSLMIAFTAGILSFVSPCVLPLIPSYVTYISGVSLDKLTVGDDREARWGTFFHSIAFVIGFSIIFIMLGASATMLGQFMAKNQVIMRKVGGVIVMALGVHFTGVINIGFLQGYKKMEFASKPVGYVGSILVGMVFAAGWTPCIGPILASILLYASTAETMGTGISLLAAYSLGLGIPFILSAIAINRFFGFFNGIKKHMRVISIISGIFLFIVGVLIFTNYLTIIAQMFS